MDVGEGSMSIGEVARHSGVPATTIRYYEAVGVLERAPRVNGRRAYEHGVLDELAAVTTAQRAGFTLTEVAQLLGDVRAGVAPSATWRQLAEHKLPEVDALIERAQTMRQMLEHGLACDCGSLRECAITTSC